MIQRLDFLTRGCAVLLGAAALFLAGCASVGPAADSNAAGSTSTNKVETASRPNNARVGTVPPAALTRVEIAERQAPRAVDLTNEPNDVFQRIRRGFAMPELNDDLVLYHQQWYMNRPDYLRRMVDRSSRYLYHIVDELEKRGMPTELALLPMVESAYNPMAYSRSKASGLWQFIPATGKRYNLDQDWWNDDRRDILASTTAALDYLQSIYELHGDWHLALASYNWGEGAVGRAIGKNQAQGLPTDYLSLSMPSETRNYVPKLQALKNIFRDPALMASLDLPSVPNRPFFATVTTDSHIDVKVAAKLAEMPVDEFVALNPASNRPVIKPDRQLIIPTEKLETFVNNLEAHGVGNKPLSSWQTYTLRPGERLDKIARRFGTTQASLRAANGIAGKAPVRAGQTLLVPGRGGDIDSASQPEPSPQAAPTRQAAAARSDTATATRTYTVKKGETLATIAKRNDISLDELKKINKLKGDRLAAGVQLKLAGSAERGRSDTPAPKARENEPAKTAKTIAASNPGNQGSKTAKAGGKTVDKTARYTVRRGDTLYSIARQHKVDADDLMRWNRVSPSNLKPGLTLIIQLGDNS